MVPPCANAAAWKFDTASFGNLDRLLAFHVGMIGFRVVFTRPEDRFAYLDLDGVHLMLEELGGSGRYFTNAPRTHPYDRGINFQIEVADVYGLYAPVRAGGSEVPIPLEDRWYRQDATENGTRQFGSPTRTVISSVSLLASGSGR